MFFFPWWAGCAREDADLLRIETLTEVSDVEALEKYVRRERREEPEPGSNALDSDAESESDS